MALTDSLISYWKLDEASGDALDAHGSNTLTETSGTIDATTGKINGCRDFELGDTEYFTIADNASLSTGDIDFSMFAWVQLESKPAAQMKILDKLNSTGNQREYSLFWDNTTDRFTFLVSSAGTAATNAIVVASAFGAPSLATWYFVAAGHNATANDIWISINAGTPATLSHSAGVFDSTASFNIGSVTGGNQYWDGLIDEAAFFKRDIRSDLASFYNSGNGLAYPFATGNRRRRVLIGAA